MEEIEGFAKHSFRGEVNETLLIDIMGSETLSTLTAATATVTIYMCCCMMCTPAHTTPRHSKRFTDTPLAEDAAQLTRVS